MKKFNLRAFASISMFCLIIFLFVTAIGIEIIDHVLNQHESHFRNIVLRVHVITGFLFCALSIIHIIKNWKVLKNYIIKK